MYLGHVLNSVIVAYKTIMLKTGLHMWSSQKKNQLIMHLVCMNLFLKVGRLR